MNRDSIVYKGSVADAENPSIVVIPSFKAFFNWVKEFIIFSEDVLIGFITLSNADYLVAIS